MTSVAGVFVVDDEEPIRRAFEVLLEAWGLPVRTFSSAEDFLRSYRDHWTGDLFIDLRMPSMSGWELYGELRQRKTALSVVLMTGHGSRDFSRELLDGETVVLEKPFAAEELKRLLRHHWPQFQRQSVK
jgi:two-component system C4-dicarboxylate transport response regulator DctD